MTSRNVSCYNPHMFQPDQALNPISFALFKSLPLLIMALLIFNMVQRALYKGWGKKRAATFYYVIIVGIIFSAGVLIMRFRLSDLLLIPVGLGSAVFITLKRKILFPFTLTCGECKTPLSLKRIVSNDSNLCGDCEKTDDRETE